MVTGVGSGGEGGPRWGRHAEMGLARWPVAYALQRKLHSGAGNLPSDRKSTPSFVSFKVPREQRV